MHPTDDQVILAELERILSSAAFAGNERANRFLRFVVEQEISGLGEQVKESVIGVEVFGRSPNYDVRRDSVVRTEAAKLRDRLAAFYTVDNARGTWSIELPKGGYRPVFRLREPAATMAAISGRSPARRIWWLVAVLCGVGVLALALRGFPQRHSVISIAVLPLLNLSQDPGNEYFSDGLTSEIIRNLSLIEGLTVRSQTSSFALKGNIRDVHEMGRQLAVEYLLEGSVLRTGQKLRINAQLIRVRDDIPLWTARYDRQLNDIFVIQDEISYGIVNSLRLKLGNGRRRYETSVEAYDFYLRAGAKKAEPLLTGISASIDPFEQAIAKDPSFAPAHAGLAAAYAAMSGFDVGNRPENLRQMREFAARAIQLDPLLAEAYDALGTVQARDALWDLSEKSFRRAIELDPNDAEVRKDYVMYLLFPLGRVGEAVQQARLEANLDPLSPGAQANLAMVLRSAGQYVESARHCLPQSPCVAAALLGEGKVGEAMQILEPLFQRHEEAPGAANLAVAYVLAKRREEAEKFTAKLPRPLEQAIVFAAMEDRERTVEALVRAVPLGPVRIGRALVAREMRFIRNDPRVQALCKNVGLPPPMDPQR